MKAYIAKLIDSQGESFETTHWLDTALAVDYIDKEIHQKMSAVNIEIQKMLASMIRNPDKFCK